MIIHDDIFTWDGWGGVMRLASGKCRLRIIDLRKINPKGVTLMKPFVVVVEDLPSDGPFYGRMSVRSCCNHIATQVSKKFNIDPARMLFVEYYPPKTYGKNKEYTVTERIETVELTWSDGKALNPSWKPMAEPMRGLILDLIRQPPAAD